MCALAGGGAEQIHQVNAQYSSSRASTTPDESS